MNKTKIYPRKWGVQNLLEHSISCRRSNLVLIKKKRSSLLIELAVLSGHRVKIKESDCIIHRLVLYGISNLMDYLMPNPVFTHTHTHTHALISIYLSIWFVSETFVGNDVWTSCRSSFVCTQLNSYKYSFHFHSISIICLYTVKWFSLLLSKTNNSINQVFISDLHTAVWFQITNHNNP